MIKAGENTASAYNAAYLKLNKVATVNNIAFGAVDGLDRYGKATPGKAVTLGAVDNVYQVTNNGTTTTVKAYHGGNIYDAFVTYEGSDADSILNKVVIDGMNVTVNAEKGSNHKFKVTWLDVNGAIGSSNVTIAYQGDAPATPETVTSIATSAYTATTVTKDAANSFVVDFAPYFNTLSSSDRILWNDDAVVAAVTNNIYYEYTKENQYGVVETKKVYLKDVVSSVNWLKTDGKAATNKADYAKLQVVMNTAYTATNVDDNSTVVYDFGNGTFTMDVTVKSENLKIDQTIKVPFTIAAPTQTEIDKQVVFNEAFFDATSRVYTVLNDETLTLSTMFTGGLTVDFSGAELGSGIKWNSDAEKGKVIKLNGDKGVASTISKAKVTYMSRSMQISTFSVKFADEKGASINFGKALEVGCANGTIKVKNGTTLTAAEQNSGTYYTYYQVKTFNGQVITPSSMTVENTADLKYIDSVELSGKDLVVKTKADKIANDVTEKVKVTFNGTYTVEFNVKVLGIAAQ